MERKMFLHGETTRNLKKKFNSANAHTSATEKYTILHETMTASIEPWTWDSITGYTTVRKLILSNSFKQAGSSPWVKESLASSTVAALMKRTQVLDERNLSLPPWWRYNGAAQNHTPFPPFHHLVKFALRWFNIFSTVPYLAWFFSSLRKTFYQIEWCLKKAWPTCILHPCEINTRSGRIWQIVDEKLQ